MSSTEQVPLTRGQLVNMARAAATGVGLDPQHTQVFLSLIQHESGWDPTAQSPVGAMGLGQLMPGTASSLGVADPKDPVQNLRGSAQYFKQQLAAFGGNANLALAAYNAGPAAVRKYNGIPPYAETQAYVQNVMGGADQYKGMVTDLPNATPNEYQGAVSQLPNATPGQQQPGVSQLSSPMAQGLGPVISPLQLQAMPRGMQGQALQSQLQRIGGGFSGVTNALSAGGAKLPSLVAQDLNSPIEIPHFTLPGTGGGGMVHPDQQPMIRSGASGAPLATSHVGDPIPSKFQTSVGGLHPTMGLDGFPAHDYMAPAGSPVVAPITGVVVKLSGHPPSQGPTQGPHGPFGWSVYIQGNDGRTYYMTHMGSRNVKVGEKVTDGQDIGAVGNYAKYGTPSHIHMGVSAHGVRVS